MNFGDYLRKHRTAKGITLAELSRRAEISRAYLTQVEKGTKDPPSEKILSKLANELDIPEKVLFRLANGELFDREYLEQSIDYGELYQKMTAIQDGLHQLAREERNVLKQYQLKKEARKIDSVKELTEQVQEKMNELIRNPTAREKYPEKVETILEELFEIGDHGQGYVLDQIAVYKKYC